MLEVLEASTACGSVMISSSCRKIVALAFGDLARADPALQRLGDAVAACGHQRLGGLEDHHVDAGPSAHFGDSAAHLPGTDHADPLDGCCSHVLSQWFPI